MSVPQEIAERWKDGVVLKRDFLSTIERGRFVTQTGEVEAVMRRIDQVPWWSFAVARHLFSRERRALAGASRLGVTPPLLFAGERVLVRGWIDGVALHVAKPYGDRAYFRSAKAALRKLHRAGICHNDLSKQQNWLRGRDGRAYLTDFQLSSFFPRRSLLFRVLAYEDLRHLLKHKHRYLLDEFTPAEWSMRSRKSGFARLWLQTGKRLYHLVTRGVFGFIDQEGGGVKVAKEAPRIVACLKRHPQVRDAAVVAFYDRGAKHSLYSFVEGASQVSDAELRDLIARDAPGLDPPEHIQVSATLPRDESGNVRLEVLQLIASNQLDEIDLLVTDEGEREIVRGLIAERRNLRDRF